MVEIKIRGVSQCNNTQCGRYRPLAAHDSGGCVVEDSSQGWLVHCLTNLLSFACCVQGPGLTVVSLS